MRGLTGIRRATHRGERHCCFRESARGFSLVEALLVVAISGVVLAVAVPMMGNTLGFLRLSGDARSVTTALSLAKLRAASDFSQVRLFADLTTNRFHLEAWQKSGTPAGVAEGGTTS